MATCVVCLAVLSKSYLRRRLTSESTKHVVPILCEAQSRAFSGYPTMNLDTSEAAAYTFLCRKCFKDLDKLVRLKKDISVLELEVVERLKKSGEVRGLQGSCQAAQIAAIDSVERVPLLPSLQVSDTSSRSPEGIPPLKRQRLDNTLVSRVLQQPCVTMGSPDVSVVIRRRETHSIQRLTSSLKGIGRSIGRRSRKSIALHAMKDKKIKTHLLKLLNKEIEKELTAMCSLNSDSLLRATNPTAVRSFSWDSLTKEMQQTTPTLYSVLEGALNVHISPPRLARRKTDKVRRVNKAAITGLCAALLCRYRNQSMNLLQRIVSVILYRGGANKQVFSRLQKLLVCLSHKRTIAYLDKVGENHDGAVLEWRKSILKSKSLDCNHELDSANVPEQPRDAVIGRATDCADSSLTSSSSLPNDTHSHSSSASTPDRSTATSHPDEFTTPSHIRLNDYHQLPTSPSISCSSSSDTPLRDSGSCNSPLAPAFSPILSSSSSQSLSTSSDESMPCPAGQAMQVKTYKLVGDNIDKTIRPRHMRVDSQTRSLHYFHVYGVCDRVDVSHLDDNPSLPSLDSIDVTSVLPTKTDVKTMRDLFCIHVARVLKKHVKFCSTLGEGLERHIAHRYSSEMSRKSEVVPLGVLLKNEMKTEDMVSICEDLHTYVPSTSTEQTVDIPGESEQFKLTMDHFHYILLGGDQLTVARVRGSKQVRSNSERGQDRLEGLVPVVEDWHAKGCFLTVIWKRLYKSTSARDCGTLYNLRNLLNRRNVVNDPMKAVDACKDFFLLVVECHIVAAAMAMFGLSAVDGIPTNTQLFPAGCEKLSSKDRKEILLKAAGALVDKHIDIPMFSTKRERKRKKNIDAVAEYAHDIMSLGLLLIEFNDAIHEGDGERICRCWQFLLLIFKATRRKNYAIEAFILLAQLNFLFSPRMVAQLKWSRTINTVGRPGKNISCDLHMEHLNRLCKGSMGGLGANISDRAVVRVGKCLGPLSTIIDSFDEENGLPRESGSHAKKSTKQDCEKMLARLLEMKLFQTTPGRKHTSFPNFRSNPVRSLKKKKLKKWMERQMNKLLQ